MAKHALIPFELAKGFPGGALPPALAEEPLSGEVLIEDFNMQLEAR